MTARAGTSLRIAWPDQSDDYAFSEGNDGRTRVRLERKGNEETSKR
ncbi:MAG TPA: hypothetical protein VMY42_27220 [Thermoguttaceae bacterium]|nr:hypothetical protein [Thermoguttaceae bacterium]